MDLETLAGAGRAPPPAPLAQGPSPQSTVNLRDPLRQTLYSTVRYMHTLHPGSGIASLPSEKNPKIGRCITLVPKQCSGGGGVVS